MTVTVRYYAKLKEEAGLAQETVETQAATVGDLWAERSRHHGFSLDASLVKAAQADEFCPWDEALVPSSLVVFMPPVAGG
jgi:molybdopterin synthase sulfur carrier subunit